MDARPPFDPTKPVEGFLQINAHGQWLYRGEPITHPGLVGILESNYRRDEEGRYLVFLKLPMGTQKVVVEFEDTPFFVRDVVALRGGEGAKLLLNDTTAENLVAGKLYIGANGATYAKVKDGEWAKFSRQAELRLGDLLEEHEGALGVVLGGRWSAIGMRDDR